MVHFGGEINKRGEPTGQEVSRYVDIPVYFREY